jgi:ribosome-associated translation inhibitor RaiA
MVKVIFKNLEKSDLVRQVAAERIEKTISKFTELDELSSTVIVSREHSPAHAGADSFSAKLLIGGRHGMKPVVLEKRATSLYQAVAQVADKALEIIHRAITKDRDTIRHKKRRWKSDNKWKMGLLNLTEEGA